MRKKLLVLSWIAAAVLLAWPSHVPVSDNVELSCGPAARAFLSDVAPVADFSQRALDTACAREAYGRVAAAAAVAVIGTVLVSIGWRKRQRRRRAERMRVKAGRRALRKSSATVTGQDGSGSARPTVAETLDRVRAGGGSGPVKR